MLSLPPLYFAILTSLSQANDKSFSSLITLMISSLVKDVNDGSEDAKALGKLLKGMLCHVNLIPVNEVKENSFKRSSEKTIQNFENILKNTGVEVTVRREMGSDINAACGQLRRSYIKENDIKLV